MNADNKNSNSTPTSNFLRAIIESDNEKGTYERPGMPKVITRFPPEPNGYLHIGHAKSICLNFGWQETTPGVAIFGSTTPIRPGKIRNLSIRSRTASSGLDSAGNREGRLIFITQAIISIRSI